MQDYISKVIDINGEIGTVAVKQFDNLSRYIHLQILDEDLQMPMNLVGCEVRLYADLLDDIGFIDGEVADGENGIITFLLPNSLTQNTGSYQAEIWITNADELSTITTKPFTITVEKSLRDGRRLEATGQFSALENALFQVAIDKARLNNLIAMTNEGAGLSDTSSTEVLDIRTGYDGTLYDTAGNAVRGQIQEIHDSVATNAEFLAYIGEDYDENEEVTALVTDLQKVLQEASDFQYQIANLTRQIESIAQLIPSGSISAEKLSAALQRPDNVISAGTVAAMLDCAESYFNYAYTADGQDSGIIYESNKGLYSPSLGTNANNGQYSIVCSQFVDAVLNGICFENSRYAGKTKNEGYRWGVVFDDTVEFGKTIGDWSTQDDIDAHNFEATHRYLISSALAKYAAKHDCLYMIDGKQNIRAGDVLFSRKKDYYPRTQGAHIPSQDMYYPYPTDNYKPYAFMGIDHVSVVVNVSGDYVTLMEAWPSEKIDNDGTTKHDVGVRISYRNLITQSIGESVYVCGATLPMGDASYMPNAVETLYDLSGDTSSTTSIYEFKRKVQKGFYTIVCHGTLTGEPYISIKYDGATSNTWQSAMHQVGNDCYLTVYAQKSGVISLRMNSHQTYAIDEVSLYKGYADISAEQPHPNRLESGDDLDNCYEGEWYCQNKTTAEAIAHAPLSEATGGFYLDARRMTNGERFLQTVWYAASPGKMYVRMYIASGWMDWLVFSGKAVSES